MFAVAKTDPTMELKLYDTLTREKRPFTPIDRNNVRMYVCGPTVYDFAHIGNARPVIVFDVLFRLLRHLYGADHVTYVRNITDVDDKINARAAERGISIGDLTRDTYQEFRKDAAALGCLPPTIEPRATEHIAEMRELIRRLVESGHAYVEQEHVLFSVPSMPDYGRLSHRSLDEMIAGARVEVAPYKRDPTDFVLWKPSKPGEPHWPSPVGIATPGRPGWHIECSAMSWKHLGQEFDIHGGGIDLVFPHHENEIAQSRCAFHTPVMANYWMHNGFLQIEGAKMAKSKGNFVTIRELLDDGWPGEVLRFNMLRTQYRQPIDWTVRGLEESKKNLDEWYALSALALEKGIFLDAGRRRELYPPLRDALFDDLNTPRVIMEVQQLRNAIVHGGGDTLIVALVDSLDLLGFLQQSPVEWNAQKQRARGIDCLNVQALIEARNAARKAKNFKEADRIRDELAAAGIVLKDSKDGTTWEIAR
jgi:cysteinyl-tRNA synthetase